MAATISGGADIGSLTIAHGNRVISQLGRNVYVPEFVALADAEFYDKRGGGIGTEFEEKRRALV